MLVHLTARVRGGTASLSDWDVASRLWRSLRRCFPAALAAVLMPEHLHLICEVADPDRARRRLAHALGALTRSMRRQGRRAPGWEEVPAPAPIPDRRHLRRQLRYVALNPCRAGLVADPLAWTWSTHRDVLGAVADPWVDAARLADALGEPRRGFAARYHAYVSGDPSCSPTGTPPPRPAEPSSVPRHSLAEVRAAAAAATRARPGATRRRSPTRRLFLQLALRHGWDGVHALADACGVRRRAVTRARGARADREVGAADLCLGDARLRAGVPEERVL